MATGSSIVVRDANTGSTILWTKHAHAMTAGEMLLNLSTSLFELNLCFRFFSLIPMLLEPGFIMLLATPKNSKYQVLKRI